MHLDGTTTFVTSSAFFLFVKLLVQSHVDVIDPINKYHNDPVPYPTMHHSGQKCAYLCSEWYVVEYGTDALRDL